MILALSGTSVRAQYVPCLNTLQEMRHFKMCQITHMVDEAESKPGVSILNLEYSLLPNLSCLSAFNICT